MKLYCAQRDVILTFCVAFFVAFCSHALGALLGDEPAHDFVENAADFVKHKANGESAWADLDAIGMACATMEMTGDYVAAYAVLDILLSMPDAN
jgi:hypothetical protein